AVGVLLLPCRRRGLHDAGGCPHDGQRIRAGTLRAPGGIRAARRGAGDDDRPRAPPHLSVDDGGPMNTRKQILVSAALVGAALGTVVLYSAIASPATALESMQGHVHAAMTGGGAGAARSVQLDAEAARRIGATYATAMLTPLQREV